MQHLDFYEALKGLSERASKVKDTIKTEEATKMALIVPFIQVLGYDVFNPSEVTPELIADVGVKKGEKVDYAILKENNPIIIIECKHHSSALSFENASQLARYFHVTTARFGILTNGIVYKFFTDLVEPNKMDEKPFFEFDIININEAQSEELKKFHKTNFDLQSIVNTASDLKHTKLIKDLFNAELESPSEDFVRYFAKKTYDGVVTQKVLEQFKVLTQKSLQQCISDIISGRLRKALSNETAQQAAADKDVQNPTSADGAPAEKSKGIETTVDEMEAFYTIKGILRKEIDPKRIYHRDSQSYFSVILDDSNRKPVCRIYFTNNKKQIGLIDESKKEQKIDIADIDSIYQHADALIKTASSYPAE